MTARLLLLRDRLEAALIARHARATRRHLTRTPAP